MQGRFKERKCSYLTPYSHRAKHYSRHSRISKSKLENEIYGHERRGEKLEEYMNCGNCGLRDGHAEYCAFNPPKSPPPADPPDLVTMNCAGCGKPQKFEEMSTPWGKTTKVWCPVCPPDNHVWKGQRAGGDPADAGSYEWVSYCENCGVEQSDETENLPCPPEPDYPDLVSELLPCPFCGSTASFTEANSASGDKIVWLVGCDSEDCPAMPLLCGNARKVDAKKAWNTRAIAGHFFVGDEKQRRCLACEMEYTIGD
jgi:hypothetical protein